MNLYKFICYYYEFQYPYLFLNLDNNDYIVAV